MVKIFLKIIFIKAENLYMGEENKTYIKLEKNVEHLRCIRTQYQIVGIAPPAKLLIELKMAERLLQLESIDSIRIYLKV